MRFTERCGGGGGGGGGGGAKDTSVGLRGDVNGYAEYCGTNVGNVGAQRGMNGGGNGGPQTAVCDIAE